MAQFSADDLMFKPGLMTGERILITGGGTGLGKVMAEALLMLGAEVYICGRRGGVVEATAKELMDAHGGKCVGLACDIRVPEAIAEMLDIIWADGGALSGLVNNAAGNFISRTQDLSPRGFDAIANIVFRGSFFVTLDCGKRWIAEGRRASVISILTTWIWNGGPFTVPSAMSKAGIATMAQSLAVEWGSYGIRFNNIAPGPFPTEGMSARLNPTDSPETGGRPWARARWKTSSAAPSSCCASRMRPCSSSRPGLGATPVASAFSRYSRAWRRMWRRSSPWARQA